MESTRSIAAQEGVGGVGQGCRRCWRSGVALGSVGEVDHGCRWCRQGQAQPWRASARSCGVVEGWAGEGEGRLGFYLEAVDLGLAFCFDTMLANQKPLILFVRGKHGYI